MTRWQQVDKCLLPPDADHQQPLVPAACLDVAVTAEYIIEGLTGPYNGRAKGMQELPPRAYAACQALAGADKASISDCLGNCLSRGPQPD